ncbi:hypothetical protein DW194_16660 [Subdoligranulum sp. AM16-9]|nr:hypothetical protein DW194_16660 [Subdoligranulum sp. AM16-9]
MHVSLLTIFGAVCRPNPFRAARVPGRLNWFLLKFYEGERMFSTDVCGGHAVNFSIDKTRADGASYIYNNKPKKGLHVWY